MAVPHPTHIDGLISEAEVLKFKFQYSIQSKNIEAYNKNIFFQLSPHELKEIPAFSDFEEKIKFYTLIYNCIKEINESIHRVIETEEHVKRYLKGIFLKVEEVRRSLCCLFLDTFTEVEKEKYLVDDFYRSRFDDMRTLKRINPPRDPTVQLSEPLNLTGMVNIHSGTLLSDIKLTRDYVLMCHFLEAEFERLRHHVNEQIEQYKVFGHQETSIKIAENKAYNTTKYLISEGNIVDLRKILVTENIIEEINLPEFLNCFDLTKNLIAYPQVLYKRMFVFALSKIVGMNSIIAQQHFGVKNYDKTKSENKKKDIPKVWRATQHKITSLLTLPIKVTSE